MTTIESLKSILNDQVSGYRTLLDVLRKEREYLVNLNAPGVEALSKEKDTVVLQLRLLEDERCRLIKTLAEERGISATISLQSLAQTSGDDTFQQLRLQLISLLQGIVEMNEFNRVLIERSSGIIKNALNFLGSFGVAPSAGTIGTRLSTEA